MEKISEIWIINEAGIPLFNKSVDNKVDPALFGGFLSAIQRFVEQSFEGGIINQLFLGTSKFFLLHVELHHLYVVVRTTKKAKDKEITSLMERIRDLFLSHFQAILEKNQGDITEYQAFNKILEEYFKNELVSRMKNWFEEV